MNINNNTICNLKHFITYNTISSINDKTFYNSMDEGLIKKRFSNAYDLSTNEHIFKIDMFLISSKDVMRIVGDFLKVYSNKKIFQKRNLYEILKISNLSQEKLDKLYSSDKILNLINALNFVSRETKLISFDFLILRIFDNILKKAPYDFYNKDDIITSYNNLINKLKKFQYIKDEKEVETNYLCWIDRLLTCVVEKEISSEDFKVICNKIIDTTTHTIYLYWKILNSISYLLLQKEFSSHKILREYKSEIEKIIEEKYCLLNISLEELKNLTISTLAKDFPEKEDFYYLFDLIAITASKSSEDKDFCLDLCLYIVHYDAKYNIFSYRFIRKYFIDMVFKIIRNFDSIDIKNKELLLLIKMFHIDYFFSFYKKDIFLSIVNILKNIIIFNNNIKLTNKNFYKYLDVVDYILYTNDDLDDNNIIEYLCFNKETSNKISKHFELQKSKH